MPHLYWCPHQVLKATGAPALRVRSNRFQWTPWLKVSKTRKQIVKPWILPKRTNEFDFTTIISQVDLFSFILWKKLKTPKRYFEINWPLALRRKSWKVIAISALYLIFFSQYILEKVACILFEYFGSSLFSRAPENCERNNLRRFWWCRYFTWA